MQLNDRDKSYLWDISEACKDILQFIANITPAEFADNKMIRYAVERQIIVIGEAANHLSESFINSTPDIPWKRIIGMRNIIAHEYGEILVERIWLTATNHIDDLLQNVSKYLTDSLL